MAKKTTKQTPIDFSKLPKRLGTVDDGRDLIGDDEDDEDETLLAGGDDEDDQDQDDEDDQDQDDEDDQDQDDEDETRGTAADIAELRGRVSSQQDTITALLKKGGNADEIAEDLGAAGLDLNDLPDPVTDRAKHNAELQKRINKYVQSTTGKVTKELTAAAAATAEETRTYAQVQNLEREFNRAHPKLGKKTALLQAVVSQEANKIRASGRDPKAVMFGDTGKFISRVAKRMNEELGISAADDTTREGRNALRKGNRTKSVSRGSGGKGGPAKKQGEGKPKGFVQQIRDQQAKWGLF
jgi:hypothetical protein